MLDGVTVAREEGEEGGAQLTQVLEHLEGHAHLGWVLRDNVCVCVCVCVCVWCVCVRCTCESHNNVRLVIQIVNKLNGQICFNTDC